MISPYRERFNANYKPEQYGKLLSLLESRSGVAVPFRISETPCFFPASLLQRLAEDGTELIEQLVGNREYLAASQQSIPPQFDCPREDPHPLFVQVDFGLVRDEAGGVHPKLVEIQGFPSLYGFQPLLAESYCDAYGLDPALDPLLGGLSTASYRDLLGRAIVGDHAPENVVLLEIDPLHQKTLPDFLVTQRVLGIPVVNLMEVVKEGRRLSYRRDGTLVPIERIYNRVIVDELERKHLQPPFSFSDDLDVEWAGHPNWFFRISKFSIPYLDHPSVPRTWFLNELADLPGDPENYVLKPLYSFAGLGVIVGPTREQLEAVPPERRSDYILQERQRFAPLIETPYGPTQAEVRVMYIWLDRLMPVTTIIRMGRGKMMGVDHNRDLLWVGASASLSPPGT